MHHAPADANRPAPPALLARADARAHGGILLCAAAARGAARARGGLLPPRHKGERARGPRARRAGAGGACGRRPGCGLASRRQRGRRRACQHAACARVCVGPLLLPYPRPAKSARPRSRNIPRFAAERPPPLPRALPGPQPENCMVERRSHKLKLIDFGLAKHLESVRTLGVGGCARGPAGRRRWGGRRAGR
jgi:hypothetical protein